MISHSQRPEYFERKYITGGYEIPNQRNNTTKIRYKNTLAVLPKPHYEHALELGCGVGTMTEYLSCLCARVIAVDCAQSAISQAQQRFPELTNVNFKKATVPDEFPVGHFDLITMCEMGYYLSLQDLMTTCAMMAATLNPDGHILLVHRFGEIGDGPLNANIVHEQVRKFPDLRSIISVTRTDYLVDVLQVSAKLKKS